MFYVVKVCFDCPMYEDIGRCHHPKWLDGEIMERRGGSVNFDSKEDVMDFCPLKEEDLIIKHIAWLDR